GQHQHVHVHLPHAYGSGVLPEDSGNSGRRNVTHTSLTPDGSGGGSGGALEGVWRHPYVPAHVAHARRPGAAAELPVASSDTRLVRSRPSRSTVRRRGAPGG